MESGDVGSAGKLNAYRWLLFGFSVVMGKLLANVGGLEADDRIASGVIAERATEHLGPDHALVELVEFSLQRMSDNQFEKALSPFAPCEHMAGEHLLQMLPYQHDLLRIGYDRFSNRRWVVCHHYSHIYRLYFLPTDSLYHHRPISRFRPERVMKSAA